MTIQHSNPKLPARARVALFLANEVGEGNTFMKNQLREAIPGVEQIDRRMRELRECGWIVHTYRDDVTLAPQELRLVTVGEPIWDPAVRRAVARKGVSSADRRVVFERDRHRCVLCGVGAGEPFPDDSTVKARLTIGHVIPKDRGGSDDVTNLRTECSRCNETARHLTGAGTDPDFLKAKIKEMKRSERDVLARWMLADQRSYTAAEEAWSDYRRLPAAERDGVKEFLASLLPAPSTDPDPDGGG